MACNSNDILFELDVNISLSDSSNGTVTNNETQGSNDESDGIFYLQLICIN